MGDKEDKPSAAPAGDTNYGRWATFTVLLLSVLVVVVGESGTDNEEIVAYVTWVAGVVLVFAAMVVIRRAWTWILMAGIAVAMQPYVVPLVRLVRAWASNNATLVQNTASVREMAVGRANRLMQWIAEQAA